MARLLLWAGGNGRIDYDVGDVVAVKPDGHVWGREEDPDLTPGCPFELFDVPGLAPNARAVKALVEMDKVTEDGPERPAETREVSRLRGRRKLGLDVSRLPARMPGHTRRRIGSLADLSKTHDRVQQRLDRGIA